MYVCDMPAAYVAVDLGTEFRWARIERDPAWLETHLPAIRAFWQRVEDEDPPAPTGDEGDKAALAAMYPREQEGKTVVLDADYLDLAWQLEEAEKELKAAQEAVDEIKNRVRMAMGDAERALLADGSGWSNTTTTIKADPHPKPRLEKSYRVLRRFKANER
jgi:predicted phage-related endonuclease